MLEGGADIRFIQQLLGHEKLETTQIYAQVSIRMLKEVHTRTHSARAAGPRPGDTPASQLRDVVAAVSNNAKLLAVLAADDEENTGLADNGEAP